MPASLVQHSEATGGAESSFASTDCGQWGYQEGGPKFYHHADVSELTLATVAWLRGDTQKTYDKFNKGAASEVLQRRCRFLDPRYKALTFLTEEERTVVRRDVKVIMIRRMEASPEWQAMAKQKAVAAEAKNMIPKSSLLQPWHQSAQEKRVK